MVTDGGQFGVVAHKWEVVGVVFFNKHYKNSTLLATVYTLKFSNSGGFWDLK